MMEAHVDARVMEDLDWVRVRPAGLETGLASMSLETAESVLQGTSGGGRFLTDDRFLVWRSHGTSLALCELSLTQDLTHNAILLSLPSPLPDDQGAVGIFVEDQSVEVCFCCAGHLARLRFEFTTESVLSALSCSRRVLASDWDVERLEDMLPRGGEVGCRGWATREDLVVGLVNGGAGCVSWAKETKWTDLRDPTVRLGGRLLSRILGGAVNDKAVIALLRCGVTEREPVDAEEAVMVAVRVDGVVAVYAASPPQQLLHSLDVSEFFGEAALLQSAKVSWVTPSSRGGLRVALGAARAGKTEIVVLDLALRLEDEEQDDDLVTVVDMAKTPPRTRRKSSKSTKKKKRARLTLFGGGGTTSVQRLEPPFDEPRLEMRLEPQGILEYLSSEHCGRIWAQFNNGCVSYDLTLRRSYNEELTVAGDSQAGFRQGAEIAADAEMDNANWLGREEEDEEEDWALASVVLERFYLGRLAQPGRFSRGSIARALRYGLPNVLQRRTSTDVLAGALTAARDWFALRSANQEAGNLESSCATLASCWRGILTLVAEQQAAELKPLGFINSTETPMMLHAACLSVLRPSPKVPTSGLDELRSCVALTHETRAAVRAHLKSDSTLLDDAAVKNLNVAMKCAAALANCTVPAALEEAVDTTGWLQDGSLHYNKASSWVGNLELAAASRHLEASLELVMEALLAAELGRRVALRPPSSVLTDSLTQLAKQLALSLSLFKGSSLVSLGERTGWATGALVWSCLSDQGRSPLDLELRAVGARRLELSRAELEDDVEWYVECADAVCLEEACSALQEQADAAAASLDAESLANSARRIEVKFPERAKQRMSLALDCSFDTQAEWVEHARAWLFEVDLKLGHFEDAFELASTDATRVATARLTKELCCRGELETLLRLPWTDYSLVEAELEALARRSCSSEEADYYACLYSFRVHRCDWSGAASAMLEAAALSRRLSASVAGVTALQVVGEAAFRLRRPAGDESLTLQTPKTMIPGLLTDVSRRFLGDCSSIKRSTDVATLLARAGLHERALDLLVALGESPTAVFASLARLCVNPREEEAVVDETLSAMDLLDQQEKFTQRRITRSNAHWSTLRRLLAVDSAKTNFAYHLAAARAALEEEVLALPLWLVRSLVHGNNTAKKGSMTFGGGRADPAGLVRLYVEFGRASEAAEVVLEVLGRCDETTPLEAEWLPHSHVDAVLAALDRAIHREPRDSPYAAALLLNQTRLTAALERHFAMLAKRHQAALALRYK